MLGAQGSVYLNPGEWQFSSSYRWLRSDDHFKGKEEQHERHTEGTYKVNRQHITDFAGTLAVSRQLNVTLSIPIVATSRSNAYSGGIRIPERAEGLGDISLTGRYWLMNTTQHPSENVSLGLGLKLPTGKRDVKDRFPVSGQPGVTVVKPVDSSLQPGDGGLGLLLDLQAFKINGKTTLFASATYLANPRNVNGTASSTRANAPEHSVSDQFLARAGFAVPVKQVPGLVFTLAGRLEGVPVDDIFGDNDGFRRPGHALFVEPGLVYSNRMGTWSIGIPITVNRETYHSPLTGERQDSTIADYMFLASYSRRIGGRSRSSAPPPPPPVAIPASQE